MKNDIAPIILGSVSMLSMVFIVIASYYFAIKKREIASKEILAAIEKGKDVPLASEEPVSNYRRRGYIFTSLGIALTIAIWASSGDFGAAAWGLIPTALGVANLLIARRGESAES